MARTKSRWTGRLLKKGMFKDGGSVIVPMRLDHEPDRVVEVPIQISSVKAFCEALNKEAFPPVPAGKGNAGRHYSEEEAF